MAAADYYLCDVCSAKTFYDTAVDYDRAGDIRCICIECAKTHEVRVVAIPMQTGAAADDARDAALWREHADKLDALVTYCPTCCQGSYASKDMTRDEIIFECGKTVGRSSPAAKPADPAEEQGS